MGLEPDAWRMERMRKRETRHEAPRIVAEGVRGAVQSGWALDRCLMGTSDARHLLKGRRSVPLKHLEHRSQGP